MFENQVNDARQICYDEKVFNSNSPASFESWLYRGGKKTISEHSGYQQLNFASLGVDDPIGHHLAPACPLNKTPHRWGSSVGGIGLEPTTSSV
jgi:hypothetical protein